MLSDAVAKVVPLECQEFAYMADWHARATGGA